MAAATPTGDEEANRVTQNHYDWRGRLVLTDNTIQVIHSEYDNLGRTTMQSIDDGTGFGAPTHRRPRSPRRPESRRPPRDDDDT